MTNVAAVRVRTWHNEFAVIEEQIDSLQERKRHVYERIRWDFDRRTAGAMKAAMRYLRMDERKRIELLEFSDLGRKFITLVEKHDGVAHDWRRGRDQERAAPFPLSNAAAPIQTASGH